MHIARVMLRVSDVERSARFYERVTGMTRRAGGREPDDALELGAPDGGPVRLELRPAARPGMAPRRAAGLFHTAFRYPQRAGLAAALRELARGAQSLTGVADHGVSEALYLDDPDGLGIELYSDRPRADWPEPAAGERVRMFTGPLDLEDLLAAGEEAAELGEAAAGVDVGHVHLKVADVARAHDFWTHAGGMELMARFGADAVFLADGGYHHHVGANAWLSRGAPLEPADGPGLETVVIAVEDVDVARERLEGAGAMAEACGGDGVRTRTPDGVTVVFEAGRSLVPESSKEGPVRGRPLTGS